jgi:hypothetical protein
MKGGKARYMQSASILQTAELTLVIHDEGSSFVLCKSNRRRQRESRQKKVFFLFFFFTFCGKRWIKGEIQGEQGL